ncbi:hypothetical protein SUGI_0842440 [Cryptomeria japonica]|uniref:probable protein phosphatase 2C 4 n=1 Tax=Cryptomeria japonica TaxID=3369 RepID=UPI002414A7D1|nr:probable protein phosphatase 2C 4 [Cryptomeria japonica]GLJ40746.1 hypothetical protein SUGI_0842440 [Cryptomeria japonica]
MGNGYGKISGCFTGAKRQRQRQRQRHDIAVLISEPLDEGLGHSFCYIRPVEEEQENAHQNLGSVKLDIPREFNGDSQEQKRLMNCESTTFKSISGASVSANTSTPLTTAPTEQYNSFAYYDRAAAFESSTSFSAIPLQPVPRGFSNSGPLTGSGGFLSGPLERGFLSGPLERGYLSGPLGSGPLDRGYKSGPMEAIEPALCSGPLGYGRKRFIRDSVSRALLGPLKRVISRTISKTAMLSSSHHRGSLVAPLKTPSPKGREREGCPWIGGDSKSGDICSINLSSDLSLDDTASDSIESQNVQWAHGKAGEDRVHIVISEEHGWLFVGIYDGFNGPDAPDYLLSNLYASIQKELKLLVWDHEKSESPKESKKEAKLDERCNSCGCNDHLQLRSSEDKPAAETMLFSSLEETLDDDIADYNTCTSQQMQGSDRENSHYHACRCEGSLVSPTERTSDIQGEVDEKITSKKKPKQCKSRLKGMSRKWRESQRKWKHDWIQERLELDRKLKEDFNKDQRAKDSDRQLDHREVLMALGRALSKTEEAYLEMADKALAENPELALMGSCVLVMLMMGEDVYVMNVGDSRAILAQKLKPDLGNPLSKSQAGRDLERISEETPNDLEDFDDDCSYDPISMDLPRKRPTLGAVQLSLDHSTSVEKEVQRIKAEHLDDALSITNDRVKGSLKVTRAFGAGFLKQPKWNDALLEMFRIDYMGTTPYISCTPALYHHRLGPEDHFLILSSDGLYQYFTNEEVVNRVEWFLSFSPDGDPAQHLVEEVLFRAAKKAGMDFHELLDIPQGDRRKYHDDVSVMVVSLEGRIWRSSV